MRVLETDRLRLEPQLATHADEMFAVLSDPALYEFENSPPESVAWLRERFARLESRRSPDGTEHWLNWVVRLPNSELIGYVQATIGADQRAAIAYVFASSHWGQGFATEAVQRMVEELATQFQVRTLSAVLKRANLRSLMLLNRLEFELAPEALSKDLAVEPDEALMLRLAQEE